MASTPEYGRTDPLRTGRERNSQHVVVCGNDHSPWVQAVLLGAHDRKIAHTMLTVPPLSVFLHSGILMPAAKIDEAEWLLDSERILVELGFSKVESSDRTALQRLFGQTALRRTDDPWQFWYRFSFVRDGHPRLSRRLWNQYWRAFSILYFFLIISVARRRLSAGDDGIIRAFSFFEERFTDGGPFLGGESPDTADLQLFGLVQMCGSIPGRPLAVLEKEPSLTRLREWISRMQNRFSEYERLYSGAYFEPKLPGNEPAAPLERAFFWLGAASMWIALPITAPAVFYFVRRIRAKGLVSV